MKTETYIQIGCYVAFLALLLISNRMSYDMGINNGKMLLCASQDAYLVEDENGEQCIDKDFYTSLQGNKPGDTFDAYLSNLSYEDITQ